MTFVETPRLLLRKVTEDDFPYFRADLADKEMDRMMLRWPCETEEEIRLGFEWFLYKEERAYVIVLKETGETIGNLTVYNRVPECVANHEAVQGKNGHQCPRLSDAGARDQSRRAASEGTQHRRNCRPLRLWKRIQLPQNVHRSLRHDTAGVEAIAPRRIICFYFSRR